MQLREVYKASGIPLKSFEVGDRGEEVEEWDEDGLELRGRLELIANCDDVSRVGI